jgi:hypothetical protein
MAYGAKPSVLTRSRPTGACHVLTAGRRAARSVGGAEAQAVGRLGGKAELRRKTFGLNA